VSQFEQEPVIHGREENIMCRNSARINYPPTGPYDRLVNWGLRWT
jgi:hypothetical protein